MTLEEARSELGIDESNSVGEAQHAYRDLSEIWRPDLSSGDGQRRAHAVHGLTRLNEAYRIILLEARQVGYLTTTSSDRARGPQSQLPRALSQKERIEQEAKGMVVWRNLMLAYVGIVVWAYSCG